MDPPEQVVDQLNVVASRVDGATVTVDVADAPGTIVLGSPDSYLYGCA